ncbi:hypothetical protein TNIN_314911 [Trichonephila inaurata madagascariensis]|uniref:Uncharacterized protein n=1 Tax=Trichonephila inaurata madagascariensis TaxID=2747483 RepID=A0A8X6YRN0_9ARAC|nr:hypothetical protein TNIN_314911 [Trichonephila inaurata madagascariensis]
MDRFGTFTRKRSFVSTLTPPKIHYCGGIHPRLCLGFVNVLSSTSITKPPPRTRSFTGLRLQDPPTVQDDKILFGSRFKILHGSRLQDPPPVQDTKFSSGLKLQDPPTVQDYKILLRFKITRSSYGSRLQDPPTVQVSRSFGFKIQDLLSVQVRSSTVQDYKFSSFRLQDPPTVQERLQDPSRFKITRYSYGSR